jgi:hypothetical protein
MMISPQICCLNLLLNVVASLWISGALNNEINAAAGQAKIKA